MAENFNFKVFTNTGNEYEFNISNYFPEQTSVEVEVNVALEDTVPERFVSEIWLTIFLTFVVLCCLCFLCSCFTYHKYQHWRRVIEARNAATLESAIVESELPSYTIASGLPTYEEALERLKEIKDLNGYSAKTIETDEWTPHTPPTPAMTLSVINLFPSYKNNESVTSVKTT